MPKVFITVCSLDALCDNSFKLLGGWLLPDLTELRTGKSKPDFARCCKMLQTYLLREEWADASVSSASSVFQILFSDRRERTPLALEPPASHGVVANVFPDSRASAPLPSTFPPFLHLSWSL